MSGYRGYVASRSVRGVNYPQRVQNLVVRDYAARNGLRYLLSVTEYALPGSYLMLAELLSELERLEGAIFFSLFMLPPQAEARRAIYARFRATGTTLHAALENRALRSELDADGFEQTLLVAQALPSAPFGARYGKDGISHAVTSRSDAALLAAGRAPDL